MYKVVIVDDEEIIANGLKTILPWDQYDCQVVGIAYDGKEGMEVIHRERPDILFTDIRMPEMDGLTMVTSLKSEFPRLQITVLTGFRDFEYAQTAIKLGVCRFLLKPSKMDELHEALTAMTDALKALPPAPPAEPEPETVDEPDPEELDEDRVKHVDTSRLENPDDPDFDAHSFVVQNALAYIAQQHATKLTLAQVADHIYVSQWHLSKLLKRHLNASFYDLLNNARVEAAKELLKDPSLKVGDIAARVGFSNTTHFSKIFKKIAGCSANDYRNLIQQ